MSLLEQIRKQRSKLSHTKTVVKTVTGDIILESRQDDNVVCECLPIKTIGFIIDTKPDFQVAKIISNLYMGSQDVTQDISLLRKYNIEYILSIGINALNKFSGINYIFIKALDIPEFNLVDIFDKTYEIIYDVICVKKKSIYVHCSAGISRSATVVIAYLMRSCKMSYDKAYTHVKKCRNVIKPNDGFIKQLKSYEVVCNK